MTMDHHEFKDKILTAAAKNQVIVFSCNCIVWYSGKAESYLGPGDRLVVIKADKTILVHQPSGAAPINYMKAGTTVNVNLSDEGEMFLNCSNIPLKDYLDMKINHVHFLESYGLEDGQSIQIAGTEDDMSQMLYENPHLIEEGFKPVSREEQTKYGYIDVMGTDNEGKLVIVECKKYNADLSAVTQLRRYVEKIMASKGLKRDAVRGILASPKIGANAQQMLEDWGFEFVSVRPPKYLERYDKNQKSLADF